MGSSLIVFGQTKCKASLLDNQRHLNTAWTLNEMKLVGMERQRVTEKRHGKQCSAKRPKLKTAHVRGRTYALHSKGSAAVTSA